MSTICTDVSLATSLLPDDFQVTDTTTNSMIAVARLLSNLLQQTTSNFMNKNIRAFDANPGDSGCQMQAVILRRLFQSNALLEETKQLNQAVQGFLKELNLLESKKGEAPKPGGLYEFGVASRSDPNNDATKAFFQKHITPLKISNDMLYLLRARLLTVTKKPVKTLPNGIVVTQINEGLLSKLSKSIFRVDFPRNAFLAEASSRLSEHSVELIRGIEEGLSVRDPLTSKMLFKEHIHRPKVEGFPSKAFSCLFFQMRAILQHLKEENAVIAIKSIEQDKKQAPTHHFMQASQDGFVFIEKAGIDPKAPLVVFEAVIQGDLVAQIEKIGFENAILISAAQERPFDPKSTLDDVKNEEAEVLILEHREKAKEAGLDLEGKTFLLLDHVYCNTMEKEGCKV